MNVLVIGSGGREHSLAWKLANSPSVSQVFVAPGNAGTAAETGVKNVLLDPWAFEDLANFAEEKQVALTIVGPEAPLVAGIMDHFHDKGQNCLGPSRAAAQLESSKEFAKRFMSNHGIPTAEYVTFDDSPRAVSYVRSAELPLVIKADGLAAGKGVVLAHDRHTAVETVQGMLSGDWFGDAGRRVVIEEFLPGEEASFICLVDGHNLLPMASSQDHKAAFDGDKGPNTGGMGAYSPAPLMNPELTQRVIREVIRPTVHGLAAEGTPYVGFLYAGLMIGEDQKLNVVEFNCRFGDPEAQSVLTRLRSDLGQHCLAATRGELDREQAEWDPRPGLGVVMACAGYPGKTTGGAEIRGLDVLPEGVKVFHASTEIRNGQVIAKGGRALCVTALGETVQKAQALAYQGVRAIEWPDASFRTDIGYRAIGRQQPSLSGSRG